MEGLGKILDQLNSAHLAVLGGVCMGFFGGLAGWFLWGPIQTLPVLVVPLYFVACCCGCIFVFKVIAGAHYKHHVRRQRGAGDRKLRNVAKEIAKLSDDEKRVLARALDGKRAEYTSVAEREEPIAARLVRKGLIEHAYNDDFGDRIVYRLDIYTSRAICADRSIVAA